MYFNVLVLVQLVLHNYFNEGGASQLKFDIEKNLFPIFAMHTTKPESYLRQFVLICL